MNVLKLAVLIAFLIGAGFASGAARTSKASTAVQHLPVIKLVPLKKNQAFTFGTIQVGYPRSQALGIDYRCPINNPVKCVGSLNLNFVADPAFTVVGAQYCNVPYDVNPGEFYGCTFAVEFNPAAAGSFSGSLTVGSGGCSVANPTSGTCTLVTFTGAAIVPAPGSTPPPTPTPNPMPTPIPTATPAPTPTPNNSPPPKPNKDKKNDPKTECEFAEEGSYINVDSQVLEESIPVTGAPFSLHYSSDRVPGRLANYKTDIPCHGSYSNGYARKVTVSIGASSVATYNCSATQLNSYFNYVWSGYSPGTTVWNAEPVQVLVNYEDSKASFPTSYGSFMSSVGGLDARRFGLGGLMPSNLHFYSLAEKRIYFGDGSTEYADLTLRQLPATLGTGTRYMKAHGSQVLLFDSLGQLDRIIDAQTSGVLFTFGYTGTKLAGFTDAYARSTTITYTTNKAVINGVNNQKTTINLDANQFAATVVSPYLKTYTLSYWGTAGLLRYFTTPAGRMSTFTYDSEGRLISDVGPGGISTSLNRSTTANGWQLTTSTAMNRVKTHTLTSDGIGNSTRTSVVDGRTSTFSSSAGTYTSIDDNNLQTTNTMAQGRFGPGDSYIASATRKIPNSAFETKYAVTRTKLPTGSDPLAYTQLKEEIVLENNPLRKFTSTFDLNTKKLTLTSPLGHVVETTFDTTGKVTAIKDGPFLPHEYTYVNGLLSESGQSGRKTSWYYDTSLRVTSKSTPLSVTDFTYDTSGRLATIQTGYNDTVTFGYNDDGRLLSITPSGWGARTHALTPHANGKLGGYVPPLVSGVANATTYFSYNPDGQISSAERPTGLVTYSYSGAKLAVETGASYGRVFQWEGNFLTSGRTSPENNIVNQEHTGPLLTREIQNIASMNLIGAARFTYSADMRMSNVILQKNGVDQGAPAGYTYDLDGNPTGIGSSTVVYSAVTGKPTTVTQGVTETIYGWDDSSIAAQRFGQLKSKTFKVNGITKFSETVTRDDVGRIATRSIYRASSGTTTTLGYSYFPSGRLQSADLPGGDYAVYDYDGNGNRVSRSTAYNPDPETAYYDQQDRIYSYGNGYSGADNFTYGFNASGELTTKIAYDYSTQVSSTTAYAWDELGQLRSVTLPDGKVISYEYDVRGRRVGRKVNGISDRTWIYLDQTRLLAEFDGAGTLLARYVYGVNRAAPDYLINAAGTHRIVTDQTGSVRLIQLTSGAATTTQEVDYDEFGRLLWRSNSSFVTSIGFAGGIHDHDTGLIRFGARDYDPMIGRWVSKDPMLFSGGDTNLYSYVLQDPINNIDITGMNARAAEAEGGGGGPLAILGWLMNVFMKPGVVAPPFPGMDPTKSPGKEWEWRGRPESKPGSKDGNYYNPETGESLRPDLDHSEPYGPHWDWRDPEGDWWRLFPDGNKCKK